jgi:predicted  nucleic acid-binding Zn-ribbon protein
MISWLRADNWRRLKVIGIEKHQSQKYMAAIKKEHTDWKAMYQAESTAHEATKQRLIEAKKRIAELEDQISKLKVTASIVPQIRHLVETRPAIQ